MRTTSNSQKTIANALAELGAELRISEADFGGKLNIEGEDPVVASKHHLGESTAVLPPQVEFSGFKLGPRFSGEPNTAAKLDWSLFCRFRFTAFSLVPGHSPHPTKVGYGDGFVFGIRPAVLRSPDGAMVFIVDGEESLQKGFSLLLRSADLPYRAFSCASQDGLDRVLVERPRFAQGVESKMNNSPKNIANAFEGPGAEPGISEVDFGGGPEFDLPLVTTTGPLDEVSVLPPQVELSEFKLGPRFSGEPNGASKLDWSAFTQEKNSGNGKRATSL